MAQEKMYRPWTPGGYAQEPVSPAEVLPEGDLVFFLLDLIPSLDLSDFHAHYQRETRGAPPYDVTMMVTLLVYAYCVGVFSSRKIAAACERNVAFMAIVGRQRPDFRTISDFRKIHLSALEGLFVQVVEVARQAGLVKLGNLTLDGSKVKANASRHKAMSYGYMQKEAQRLREEIAALLSQAEQADAEQDAAMGSRRGDELPDELQRRKDRLAAIEQAMARLEEQARQAAEAERQRRQELEAQYEAEGRKPPGRPPEPVDDKPQDKDQTNFTDPQAKIMKTNNKGFDYSYNVQAVVDEDQIILAADVTDQANDKQQAVPMAEQAKENLQATAPSPTDPECRTAPDEEHPHGSDQRVPISMDSGYFSEANVKDLETQGFDPYIATGRQKHHAAPESPTDGPAPSGGTAKEQMAAKLRTPEGKARYAKRKHIVEPVFGQIKQGRGFRQFLLRGLSKVRGEWRLVCLTHNLLKIWRHQYALT